MRCRSSPSRYPEGSYPGYSARLVSHPAALTVRESRLVRRRRAGPRAGGGLRGWVMAHCRRHVGPRVWGEMGSVYRPRDASHLTVRMSVGFAVTDTSLIVAFMQRSLDMRCGLFYLTKVLVDEWVSGYPCCRTPGEQCVSFYRLPNLWCPFEQAVVSLR
jgi:hypothetical protein